VVNMSRDKHDEDEILKSFDDGEWQSVGDPHRRIDLKEYARATLLKDKRITLRLSSGDLMAIQSIAVEEGIPYQTLISSIVHKYVTGRLVDKRN